MNIAINITLHTEGDYVAACLASLQQNIDQLQHEHPECSPIVNIALDRADDKTNVALAKNRYLLDIVAPVFVYFVKFGDVSLARNYLIDRALDEGAAAIAIIDGDDLFSADCLSLSYAAWRAADHPVAVSPEYNINMKSYQQPIFTPLLRYFSSTNATQSLTTEYTSALWHALTMVDSRILQQHRYLATGDEFYGEDINLQMTILASDYDILIAPRALRVYRRKQHGSLMNQFHAERMTRRLAPTPFLRPQFFASLRHQDYHYEDQQVLALADVGFDQAMLDKLTVLHTIEPLISQMRPGLKGTKVIEKRYIQPTYSADAYYYLCRYAVSGDPADLAQYQAIVPHLSAEDAITLRRRLNDNWSTAEQQSVAAVL